MLNYRCLFPTEAAQDFSPSLREVDAQPGCVERHIFVSHRDELDGTLHRVPDLAAFWSAHPESNQRTTYYENAFQ
jgi:hypothetical protein